MIFLSHNFKDKPVVEQLAIRLSQIFDQNKVFYDSWSIQPGDGIIDKMNAGLTECKYFFLFISNSSLKSNMVRLEWQNALMKATKGETKIIPIRLDGSLIPPILQQTMYLDLFTNGLEVTLKQMIDIINEVNTYRYENYNFSNLEAEVIKDGENFILNILAKHYMEPVSNYLIMLNNEESEASVGVRNGMVRTGFTPNITLNNGIKGNCWLVSVSEATVPKFPLEFYITKTRATPLSILSILHEESKNVWKGIPYLIK